VATRGYVRLLGDGIDTHDNARKICTEYGEKIDAIWVEVESLFWKPPAKPEKKAPKENISAIANT
jgi:hypothetical protein